MVNLCEHEDGKKPAKDLSLADALSGKSRGSRASGGSSSSASCAIRRRPIVSQVPATLIPNPDLSSDSGRARADLRVRRRRQADEQQPDHRVLGPVGHQDRRRRPMLNADFGRISAAPKSGTREIWTLKNGGGGWDHPIHIHFEEGQILARNGKASNVPAWEQGPQGRLSPPPGRQRHASRCSSATSAACSWSTATTPCTRTTRCCCAGRSTTAATPFLQPLPTPIPTPQGVTFIAPDDILGSKGQNEKLRWRRFEREERDLSLRPARRADCWTVCRTARHGTRPVDRPARSAANRWGADYFPNVPLTTQDGTDGSLLRRSAQGQVVAVNVIYTQCKDECPLETAKLVQVQRLLGDRVGKDVFFYSISIDPKRDTPEVLKAYAEKFGVGPGWLFLTGKEADIELIGRKLGLSSRNDSADRDGHQPQPHGRQRADRPMDAKLRRGQPALPRHQDRHVSEQRESTGNAACGKLCTGPAGPWARPGQLPVQPAVLRLPHHRTGGRRGARLAGGDSSAGPRLARAAT